MSRFVRPSKYRHTFGTAYKRENIHENLRVSRNAWDTNLCKANACFISVNLEAGGGGQFMVLPHDVVGKIPSDYPVFAGHTSAVLDTDFNPYNDYIIASCGEDCKVMVWSIPERGLTENITTPLVSFDKHTRKVGHVMFHPTAENVLLSSAADLLIKLYDIQKGEEKLEVTGHTDIVNSLSWNYDGSLIATTSKDKKLRIIDPRGNKIISAVESHQGVKGSRVCWLGDSPFLVTAGFSRSSDRQLSVWDSRNMSQPAKTDNLDTMSGGLMPFFDNDTKVLFLAGKGDGNIRFYEFTEEAPYTHYLTEYKSNEPQRGLAFIPKRACNIADCEIARVFKVQPDRVEPISLKVPRKSDQFQSDLFPDTVGDKAALSADQWFSGKNANPILISLEKGFVPTVKKDFVTSAPAPAANNGQENKGMSGEKEYQDAFHALRKENEDLKNESAQKDVKIRQLEAQLEALTSSNASNKSKETALNEQVSQKDARIRQLESQLESLDANGGSSIGGSHSGSMQGLEK